jgi:hypothetical protein
MALCWFLQPSSFAAGLVAGKFAQRHSCLQAAGARCGHLLSAYQLLLSKGLLPSFDRVISAGLVAGKLDQRQSCLQVHDVVTCCLLTNQGLCCFLSILLLQE